jgi:pimeloyl-ACP methyl ester carboxylesterase
MRVMDGVKRLALEGHELEYAWVGAPVGDGGNAGDDPVLVFLHEGLGSVSTWRDFPERLVGQSGLAGFVYSRVGYGWSSAARLPRPVTFMHEEARLFPAVCATAGIRRAILVGHSDGASIALLHEGGPDGAGPDVVALALIAPHVFVEDLTVRSIRDLTRDFERGAVKQKLAIHHGDPEHTFSGWTGVWLSTEFRSWNIETCLPGIRVPVLLVQGEEDECGTERQVDSIERGIPGPVERCLIPACGHSPHRDAPDATLRALANFLRRYR